LTYQLKLRKQRHFPISRRVSSACRLFLSPFKTCEVVDGVSFNAIVAYAAATAQKPWVRRYVGGPRQAEKNSDDQAYAVAVSLDGSKVLVTGYSHGVDSFSDYATIAYGTVVLGLGEPQRPADGHFALTRIFSFQ
jgi:hypothetical protein